MSKRKKAAEKRLMGLSGSGSVEEQRVIQSTTRSSGGQSSSGTAIAGPSSTVQSITSLEKPMSEVTLGGDSKLSAIKFAAKKYGTLGQKVDLYVNFFKINLSKKSPNYFHYNIEILDSDVATASKTPKSKKTPKRLNDDVFRAVFEQHEGVFQCNVLPVFDGNKNFYSTTQFNLSNQSWSGIVKIKDGEKEETIKVNITVPEISHGQTLTTLATPKIRDLIMPVELQALDIIMRNGPRLNKISLGANFFLKSNDQDFEKYKFEIDKDPMKYGQFGHYQCAKMTEKGLYYNVDRAMAVFTYGGMLLEKINKYIPNTKRLDSMSYEDKKKVEDQIKSLKFKALHLNYNRTFIIQGLSRNSVKTTTFNMDVNGQKQQISVYDYFKKEYPNFCKLYPINPNLPCVQVGPKNNAKHFPIEACELVHDEVYRRKLDPKLQGKVTIKSQQTPFDRFEGIKKHVQTIGRDSTVNNVNYLDHFGIGVDTQVTKIGARILSAPPVEYAGGKNVDTQGKGQWDMKGCQFFQPSNIGKNWAVVNIDRINGQQNKSSIFKQKVDGLVKSLINDAKFKGINLSTPDLVMYDFNYRGKNTLEQDLFLKLKRDCKLCIIMIPNRDEIYNEIKTISEIKIGLITQCLRQDQGYWRNLSAQVITNIFLKINPKTAGTNQTINTKNRLPILRADSKLMFIGLDVTHPSPTDGLSKSIAACVGSYTNDFDKCFHKIVIQEKARKEVVNLKEIVKQLLENFNKANKFYPQKIVVYRDGIGEGDFQKVITVELESMKKACLELGIDKKIKFTYIMVQKRHNTRFIPTYLRDKDDKRNINPGTVVDKEIVHHKFFEFYLCSHAGMLGTSRPTKYVVLHDENDLSADEIQAATYYTCYLYPRCTKSSSIPPFVQYAHLLAKRGRAYLAHLDNTDGKSSIGSGGGKIEQLSQAEINQLNTDITVRPNINGTLFFI